MSGVDSTDPAGGALSPVVNAAARGELPDWARASEGRREHIARVTALLVEWAEALALPEKERARWAAAGTLHDALRNAGEEELRETLGGSLEDLPVALLHGPAAAARLGPDVDTALAAAIRYHTVGHAQLDRLGKALYLADFLEPGRSFAAEWRAGLRDRMPEDLDGVLVEVLASRIQHLLAGKKPIRPETAGFWSAVVTGT